VNFDIKEVRILCIEQICFKKISQTRIFKIGPHVRVLKKLKINNEMKLFLQFHRHCFPFSLNTFDPLAALDLDDVLVCDLIHEIGSIDCQAKNSLKWIWSGDFCLASYHQ